MSHSLWGRWCRQRRLTLTNPALCLVWKESASACEGGKAQATMKQQRSTCGVSRSKGQRSTALASYRAPSVPFPVPPGPA